MLDHPTGWAGDSSGPCPLPRTVNLPRGPRWIPFSSSSLCSPPCPQPPGRHRYRPESTRSPRRRRLPSVSRSSISSREPAPVSARANGSRWRASSRSPSRSRSSAPSTPGTLSLDAMVEIRPEDRRKIGPLDDSWKPGMTVSVARMLDVMLVDSDNTATDKLIAMLGGPAVGSEVPRRARRRRGSRFPSTRTGWGRAIRKDACRVREGRLERRDARRDGVAPFASLPWRAALEGRNGPPSRRDAPLPDRREAPSGWASPPGPRSSTRRGPSGSCTNDVGIVTLPDRSHLVVAVFVRGGGDLAAREATIARVARVAWDAFVTSN